MAKHCWNCGRELTPGANFCRFCGARQDVVDYQVSQQMYYKPYKQKKPIYEKWWFWTIISTMFIWSMAVMFAPPSEDSENEKAQNEMIQTTEAIEAAIGETEKMNNPPKEEITFRELPWGINSETATTEIESDEYAYAWVVHDTALPVMDELYDGFAFSDMEEGNVMYCSGLDVAGYDVSLANLYFMYKVENGVIDRSVDELYAAVYELDVVDHEVVYTTLQKKLSELYGDGEETKSAKKGYIASKDYTGIYKHTVLDTTWHGVNDTFVTLRWVSDDNQAAAIQNSCGVTIVYGRGDVDKRLKELRNAINEEQRKDDQEKSQSGNNEGL